LVLFELNAFLSAKISDQFLSNMSTSLMLATGKLIVRFRYNQSDAVISEAPIDLMVSHILQVAPILNVFREKIETVQGGFSGAWGEWNKTNISTPALRGRLLAALCDNIHQDVRISVRTPMYRADSFPRFVNPKHRRRVGIHNDAFMASETNLGTYERPNVEYWKDDAADSCIYGGETCAVAAGYTDNPTEIYKEIDRMSVCYLNSEYHSAVISGWKSTKIYDAINELMRRNAMRRGL
jgi:hypothetical protein